MMRGSRTPLAGLRASRFASTAVASTWESTWWALRMRDGDSSASTSAASHSRISSVSIPARVARSNVGRIW
jgi:hypothetical protein